MSTAQPQRLQFAAGETIFAKGDPSDLCYQVFSGQVHILLDSGANAQPVAELEPGEVFGEMGIIDDGPRSATAVAAVDTVCIGYARDDILGQIDRNPATMTAIMKALIHRLREANRQIENMNPDVPLLQRILRAARRDG